MEQDNKTYENTEPIELNETSEVIANPMPPSETAEPKAKGFWRDLFETILMALVLFVLLNAVTSRVKVFNISRQPTLKQGYLLLVNKMAYKLGTQSTAYRCFSLHGDKQRLHKAFIGLPGDKVDISGVVVARQRKCPDRTVHYGSPELFRHLDCPRRELFVLGDNRNHSPIPHQWGFVQESWVVGKALFIYYPLDQIASLSINGLVRAAPAQ